VKFLLDTHALIWSQDDTSKLSPATTAALTDPAHQRMLSMATVWEIGIKLSLGKLRLSKPFRVWIEKAIADLALSELKITVDYVERQLSLPFHHRDPFDRLMIAQALTEEITLVSGDALFDAYGVTRVWS
jgi:PIN domain nuclease of toxin-antitoxin system